MKKVVQFAGCVVLSIMLCTGSALAATMNDYCITPPFIQQSGNPNLLMMIDNSASMYDLAAMDKNNYCGNAPITSCTSGATGDATCAALPSGKCVKAGTVCTSDANCATAGDMCNLPKCVKSGGPCTSDANCTTAGDKCNNKCNTQHVCWDNTYDEAATAIYAGYYDQASVYQYDFTNKKFTSGATMPVTCSYSAGTTKYVCVVSAGTPEVVTGFTASGKFLNWLTASNFDIEKQILTGGKYDTAKSALTAETRGCSGRKFMKTVDAMPGITFATSGGTASTLGLTSNSTAYGQTFLQIYKGTYASSSCQNVVSLWKTMTVANEQTVMSALCKCAGGTYSSSGGTFGTGACTVATSQPKIAPFYQIAYDCACFLGLACNYSGGGAFMNFTPIQKLCEADYVANYSTGHPCTTGPACITDPAAPDYICAKVNTGAGCTWNGTACSWDAGSTTIPAQVAFCSGVVNTNPVPDPLYGSLSTAASVNVPGFLVNAGLAGLTLMGVTGDLVDGKLASQIGLAPAPTGLIDLYKDRIRFGAMVFNENGSASECSDTGTCQTTTTTSCTSSANCPLVTVNGDPTTAHELCLKPFPCGMQCSVTKSQLCYVNSDCPGTEICGAIPKTDGGKIISYVGAGKCSVTTAKDCDVDYDCRNETPAGQYCVPAVGDHTSGLIQAIDNIKATSWTPFAEAFYSALGYFARSNAYTASPPMSRSDGSFTTLPPNTAMSYDSNKNPSQFKCQNNNIMLITDGMSTADQNKTSEDLATLYAGQVPYTIGATTYKPGDALYDAANVHGATSSCPAYSGSRSISDLAWIANNRNIKTLAVSGTASTTAPVESSESIKTYVVYSGPDTSTQTGLCDPKTLMTNTATNGGTTLYSATDPTTLKNKLQDALSSVAAKTASGTAASILSNSEGSGAVLLQAVFYPRKYFNNTTSSSWIGEIQNLWYYVDPFIGNSSVREDTSYTSGTDHYLDLKADYVASFTFDGQQTNAYLQQDTNGDGAPDIMVTHAMDARVSATTPGLVSPDDVKSLWRAGRQLWKRDITTNPRSIYTYLKGTSAPNRLATTVTFTKDCMVNLVNVAGLDSIGPGGICYYSNLSNDEKDIIQYLLQAPTLADAENIIKYAHGTDGVSLSTSPATRSRTVQINSVDTTQRVWKLGDIIDSTPRIESSAKLNNYSQDAPAGYGDTTYGNDATKSGFTNSTSYKNRGMAFAGANDGMLHAFNLGQLSTLSNATQKAKLSGTDIGEEKWAFIPRNVLPYLQYLLDPLYSDKNHLYLVDGSIRLIDASVGYSSTGCTQAAYWDCPKDGSSTGNKSWHTIMIGSMGIGGASRNGFDSTGAAITCATCVKTPLKDIGYSSYFALDVTDPANPQFLWDFSSDELGYTTSGPAVVRINSYDAGGNAQKNTNGHWYAVFGNGPTGPIDTGQHLFRGSSDKNLKVFALDLLTGANLRTSPVTADPVITNAFAGNISSAPIDVDRWSKTAKGFYSDDALYFGYSNYTGTAWDGGVLRLLTYENPDPNQWILTTLINGAGPVTSAVSKIQDRRNHNLWLYFGGGRYFYRGDDQTGQRNLVAVKEPCYKTNDTLKLNTNDACTTTIAFNSTNLTDQTTAIASLGSTKGWFIKLNLQDTSNQLDAERVITDPVVQNNGAVIFTSYKPSTDQCSFGGQSFLWAMKYDTGDVAPVATRNAKVLVQVSTGEFKQVSLSSTLTDSLGRKMGAAMTGKPPNDPPPVVSAAGNKPYKRILHVQEK